MPYYASMAAHPWRHALFLSLLTLIAHIKGWVA